MKNFSHKINLSALCRLCLGGIVKNFMPISPQKFFRAVIFSAVASFASTSPAPTALASALVARSAAAFRVVFPDFSVLAAPACRPIYAAALLALTRAAASSAAKVPFWRSLRAAIL